MAITYPLALPNTSIARISMGMASAVTSSRSPFSYNTQVQRFTGQLWFADVTLPPMTREDAEEWITFILKLNGKEGTFLMGDPSKATPRGSALGTPLVNGGSQTGNSLVTDGWTAGQTNILKKGDQIQIGQRMYYALDNVNSDGSGNATFDIWPRLRESPSNNATIITSSCVTLMRLSSNNNTVYNVNSDFNYGLSFSAEEAI